MDTESLILSETVKRAMNFHKIHGPFSCQNVFLVKIQKNYFLNLE